MCNFKSGIILKNRVVLAPEGNESYSDLLENLEIADTHMNASKTFVRAELIQQNNNKMTDVKYWKYKVDQDIVPDWYEKDPERYEQEFRNAVKEYMEKYIKERNIVAICDYGWTSVKYGSFTYYFMDDIYSKSRFGDTNDYSKSDVRNDINNSKLAKDLKEKFGKKLVPIELDLVSMDGFKDYGVVKGDILSIPNMELIMKLGDRIPLIDAPYWLATPNQTPSRNDASYVRCVNSVGNVGYSVCRWRCLGVRPFFILQSQIYESCGNLLDGQ